jgi:hypothetical protein
MRCSSRRQTPLRRSSRHAPRPSRRRVVISKNKDPPGAARAGAAPALGPSLLPPGADRPAAAAVLQGAVTGAITGLAGDGITAEATAAAAARVAARLAAAGAAAGSASRRSSVALGATQPAYVTRCKAIPLAGACFGCCRRRCELGPEEPTVGGKPVAPGLRAGLCKELCYDTCKATGPV